MNDQYLDQAEMQHLANAGATPLVIEVYPDSYKFVNSPGIFKKLPNEWKSLPQGLNVVWVHGDAERKWNFKDNRLLSWTTLQVESVVQAEKLSRKIYMFIEKGDARRKTNEDFIKEIIRYIEQTQTTTVAHEKKPRKGLVF